MRRAPCITISLMACLLLGGCNRSGNDPGAGGVTEAEADALDAAAEKLEARPKTPEMIAAEDAANAEQAQGDGASAEKERE